MRYEINYLPELQAPHTSFIGATTYNTGRLRTTFNGIWEGYFAGENIFEMEYGFTYTNTKFGDNLLAQIKALEILFQNAYRYMDSETIIYLSNQRVIDWMERGQYKWMDGLDLKSQLHVWFNSVRPQLKHYNSLHPPFSILREYINVVKKQDRDNLIKHGIKKETTFTNITKSANIIIGK